MIRNVARLPYLNTRLNRNLKTSAPKKTLNTGVVSLLLSSKGLPITFGHTCILTDTPFKINTDKKEASRVPTSMGTLYITKNSGHFACSDSGLTGNWEDLAKLLKNFNAIREGEKTPIEVDKSQFLHKPVMSQNQLVNLYSQTGKAWGQFSQIEKNDISSRFGFKGLLKPGIIRKYNLRFSADLMSITFPYFTDLGDIDQTDNSKKLLGFRTHTIDSGGSTKIDTVSMYDDDFIGLFGLSNARNNQVPLIVTSNELDAMVVRAQTNFQAVALPLKKNYYSLPVSDLPIHPYLIPYFERFHNVYVWFGAKSTDQIYKIGSFQKYVGNTHLSPQRCNVIAHAPDRIETYSPRLAGEECKTILKDYSMSLDKNQEDTEEGFLTYSDLKHVVDQEIANPTQFDGAKMKHACMKKFEKIIKGLRPGELTVLTGPTGAGKTTWVAQYALVLAMYSNVRTLFGSFEVKPSKLMAKTMLPQFEGLKKSDVSQSCVYERFEDVPMFFAPHTRSENPVQFINMLHRAQREVQPGHIIIDNLQFIMGAGGGERFDIQDRFVVELRRFATECNVHVSLVCHPRKHDAGWPLQLDSIYGGVRLTQEADNVVLLQRYKQNGETRNYIDLVKNRHSGNLGKVPLVFDPETRLYNLKDVENGKGDSSGSSGSSGSRIIKNVGYEML